jgi:hypothetical protein
MKKLLCYALLGSMFLAACTDYDNDKTFVPRESASAPVKRVCAAMDVLEKQLAADPKLAGRLASIEEHTRAFIASGKGKPSGGTIVIPVIVNVIYNTAQENISLDQIESQIDVLNADFNAANSDLSDVPDLFSDLVGDFGIEFTLQSVVRKYSTKTSWGLNDNMKFSKRGGIDATDPEHTLNMWVVNNLVQGPYVYLGYAQFPGGKPESDGVVIGHNYFGDTGEVLAPYDKGRTATHEVGHWLNLRHIWGDANCGNDYVDDTPLHDSYNFGCPEFPHLSTCVGTPVEMTMNYMDYTEDLCMFMFTEGQKERSLAVFAPGGPRESFVTN